MRQDEGHSLSSDTKLALEVAKEMTEVNVKELKINPNMVRNKKYPR
jgi:signal recognition particle subunit SEC65